MKQVRKNDIDYHVIYPEHHNHNPAEGVLMPELCQKWFRNMIKKQVPDGFGIMEQEGFVRSCNEHMF
jgi:hypothetical protein